VIYSAHPCHSGHKFKAAGTIDDVYKTFCRDGKEADVFDAQKMVESLKDREKDGLPYELLLTKENELASVFWLNKMGFKHWASLGEAKCVLYDTKHGTNRYKMKLSCWTVVDCNGITRIVAFSLISPGECTEDFIWAFSQFRRHLGAPTVIFTDGDVGMGGAIAAVFGAYDTVHLLCLYHIYTNFFGHVRKLFGADTGAWRVIADAFWHIAKRSDKRTIPRFETEWAQLMALANASTGSDQKTRKLALEWLKQLGARAQKWAARWTYAHRTLDIHSTQRAEAIHSALCHIILASDKLDRLLEKLDDFETHRIMRSFEQVMRIALVQVFPFAHFCEGGAQRARFSGVSCG
jgi:hypothetical protein